MIRFLKRVRDHAYLDTSKAVSDLLSLTRLSATVLLCVARAELPMGVVAAFGIVMLFLFQELETKRCLWWPCEDAL